MRKQRRAAKCIVSFVLAVCMVLSAFPATAMATSFPHKTVEPANYSVGVSSAAQLTERLGSLIEKYKNKPWTTTGSQCPGHGSGKTCYSKYYYGWQCKGFASYIFNDLFCGGFIGEYDSGCYYIPSAKNATLIGKHINVSSSDTTTVKNLLSKAQPGDFIQAHRRDKSYGHSMIVVSVDASGVTLFDCNSDGHCTVKSYYQTWATFASKNDDFSLYHSTKYPTKSNDYVDIGTDFTAVILNTACWKPISNDEDKYVRLQTENGTARQVWRFVRQDDGSYVIFSTHNGLALEMFAGNTTPGNPVAAWGDDWGGYYQRWYIYEQGNGYILHSKHYSDQNLVLDLPNGNSTNGTQITTYPRNNSNAQIWTIYRGDECKLKGQTLTVTTGDSKTNTKFTWTEAYGENRYDVKIWKGTAWNGDPYHVEWEATSGYSLTLPAGTYQAYVDASNYYYCEMSNLVTFTVKEHTCTNASKVTSPTCTAQGYTTYTCSVCGNTYKGNYTNALGHNYSYKVKTAPTTSATGSLTGTCSRCSGTTTVTLPKLNTTNYTYKVTKAATCTAVGTGRYTWNTTTYGTFYFDVSIAKTDHKNSYEATTYPTTTSTGVLTCTCSRCSKTTTVTLPKLNTTDYTYKETKAATCTAVGMGRYTWNTTTYGTFSFVVALAKTGHSYGTWTQTKAPTCTAVGTERRDCSNCDAYETREMAAIGHDYTAAVTAPTCTECGYTTYTCSCGDSYTADKTAATGHSYGNWTQTKAPTCTATGTERRDCSKCDHYETRSVAATGHKHTAVVTKPTCTDKGYTTYTCACGDSYTGNETAATGHSYGEWMQTTATAEGEERRDCENCDHYETRTVEALELSAPVVNISANTTTGKPKLSWSAVSGADIYRVYRATSKTGTYTRVKSTSSTSFTDTTAKAGMNYYYKVKSVDQTNDVTSEFSNIVNRVCDLAKPTVSLTVNTATGKPVVKWETVDGAAKYRVYRAASKSGTYELVYTAVKARSYEDADAVAGTNYYYKVRAIHEKSSANSAYSAIKNRVCDLAKPEVSISLSGGNPKIKWNTVEDAEKYYIYRATSKTGTYTKVKTAVSARTYTDTSATAGKTYYYKVKAIHSNSAANSAYSAVKYIKAK